MLASAVAIEAYFVLLRHVFDVLDLALRWSCKIDDLPVLVGIEAMVVEMHVVQKHDDDLLAVVLGLADFGKTFGRGERLGRGEQNDRLAAGIRLGKLFPAFARADVSRSREISSSSQPIATSHCLSATAATLSLLE